jgi:hypothetical protein
MTDECPSTNLQVTYRGIGSACMWWVLAVALCTFTVVGLTVEQGLQQGRWVLIGILIVPSMITALRVAWFTCFTAELTAGGLALTRAVGVRRASVRDIERITRSVYGEGSTPLLTIHYGRGRAAVHGQRGKTFVDAVIAANPNIRVVSGKGWVRKLYEGLANVWRW